MNDEMRKLRLFNSDSSLSVPNLVVHAYEDMGKDAYTILHDENARRQEFIDQLTKQVEAEEIIVEVNDEIAKQSRDEVWNCQKYLSEEKKKVITPSLYQHL